ncbi:ATP-binding protein [Bacillus sp. T33-2]|uniref:ATP-binding protein n=1 Tax=Bacillus sp. T33-2 TaxID=2054168 RepID=UPI000C75E06A|nr:ATP-binding protein [Bacillus sp. T33-2]PLR95109.1 sporulation kinase [Bacillus sp. T33-2]
MFIDSKHVLYQILIVLFPILPMLIYHLFVNEYNSLRKKSKLSLTIFVLVMLLITMSFPVEFSDGYRYDFRIIPVSISFIYGGTVPGFITIGTMFAYRYFIGGEGFYVSLVNYSVATIVLLYFVRRCEKFGLTKKAGVVTLLLGVILVTKLAALIVTDHNNQILFAIIFYTITWICLLTVVFLIENINQQVAIRKELQRAEKLNVISQLAASVAHEVRNPMTTVRGFLQLMTSDTKLNSSHRDYIHIALNELDHAQSIINDYLSLAKPQNEELTCVDISTEVRKTVELMTSYSNIQNIKIKTAIADSLYIKGNQDEIKQVLVNIIKNGIEAMDTGGLLCVNVFEKEGLVNIDIIDSGKGMTKNQLKNLGTPFYTTKEKGTGVGLTISYQLVQSMKGKIIVESELGKGTMFTISFPSINIDSR